MDFRRQRIVRYEESPDAGPDAGSNAGSGTADAKSRGSFNVMFDMDERIEWSVV